MNTSMNLQRISVDRLKPAKYNPRKDLKPGDPAYEKIKRSLHEFGYCLLYTSPSPRDRTRSRMPSSA